MTPIQGNPNLPSGRLLASNTLWNLLGYFLPALVAVFVIPRLVIGLGLPRFGVLSLVWIVVGYFNLFDLGIGRALTKMVADKLGANEAAAIPPLVWTSLFLMFLLGACGSLVLLAISPWLVRSILKIPADLLGETLSSFYLMAISIPFITVTAGLRGVLEGLQRFRIVNLIRIPISVFSFVGPLVVLPFSRSLPWVVAVLILGRLAGCAAHLVACARILPAVFHKVVLERTLVKPVMMFGGWMTVSNVVNPILVYVDRFVIGTMVSVNAIAFYTAPFDMVVRLTVIPGAVAAVLFPAFAMSLVQDQPHTHLLLSRSVKYVFLAIFPITLMIVTLAPESLRFWLGPSFSQNSSSVLRWLCAGVLANSLAQAPFALVQSAGRPDITAKVHLIELPLYLFSVWLLTRNLGIEGTAIAWAGRLVLDTLLIAWVLQRVIWRESNSLVKLGLPMTAGLLLLYLGALPNTLSAKLAFLTASVPGLGLLAWLSNIKSKRFGATTRRVRAEP